MRAGAILLVLTLAVATPAAAQATATGGCATLAEGLRFCAEGTGWRWSFLSVVGLGTSYTHRSGVTGSVDVVRSAEPVAPDLAALRDAIRAELAAQAGQPPGALRVHEVADAIVLGRLGERQVLETVILGMPTIFAITILAEPGRTLTVTTYAEGRDFSDAHRAAHLLLVAGLHAEREL